MNMMCIACDMFYYVKENLKKCLNQQFYAKNTEINIFTKYEKKPSI